MIDYNIIIPTYNRPLYLKRILDYYYNECGEGDFEIIVADSSSDVNKIKNKEIIAAIPNLKILYLSGYPETIYIWHKFADAINYVQSKYSVFCADDDFVTPNGIKESVDFLEKNPDFAVAHGRYIRFHLEEDEKGKQKFCWAPSDSDSHESITFSNSNTRLSHHLSHYSQPTFYAVHRTELLKMISGETIRFTSEVIFGELLSSMLTLIYGKMKCLDVLYGARENIPGSGGATARTLVDFIKDGTYQERYERFRNCLSIHLSRQSRLDINESRKVIDKAMAAYMKKYYFSKSRTGGRSRMGYLLDSLNLPDWADKGIRRLYAALTRARRTNQRSMEMPPSSKYYGDFNRIRLHVLSYASDEKEA